MVRNIEALSVAKYRELVEKKINELVSSSPILQKLKQGQEITTDEAEQLAEELYNEHPHITIDLLRKVYNHRKAELVQFIKHILGIEQLETFAETVPKHLMILFQNIVTLQADNFNFLTCSKILYWKR